MKIKKIQTLVFDKKIYDRKTALRWAEKHGYKHYTSRITNNTIRLRQIPPKQIKQVLGTFKIGKGVNALYVKVK